MYLTMREMQYILNVAIKNNIEVSQALKEYLEARVKIEATGKFCSLELK